MQCDIEKLGVAWSTSLKTWAWLSPSRRILLEMLVAICIEAIQTFAFHDSIVEAVLLKCLGDFGFDCLLFSLLKGILFSLGKARKAFLFSFIPIKRTSSNQGSRKPNALTNACCCNSLMKFACILELKLRCLDGCSLRRLDFLCIHGGLCTGCCLSFVFQSL